MPDEAASAGKFAAASPSYSRSPPRSMARFRPSRLFRRLSSRESSNYNTNSRSPSAESPSLPNSSSVSTPLRVRKSTSLPRLRKKLTSQSAEVPESVQEQRESVVLQQPEEERQARSEESVRSGSATLAVERSRERAEHVPAEEKEPEVSEKELNLDNLKAVPRQPILVLQQATPDVNEVVREVQHHIPSQETTPGEGTLAGSTPGSDDRLHAEEELPALEHIPTRSSASISPGTLDRHRPTHPAEIIRRVPSIVDSANADIVKALIDAPNKGLGLPTSGSFAFPSDPSLLSPDIHDMTAMLRRKIWVKRPSASSTLVQIREDDLVDDVRDMILRKYANSLGKTFDAPDMTLHIATRSENGSARQERMLGPEESMCRTIDSYYPGGQSVEEALIINVPQRRTPRPSPRVYQQSSYNALDDYRPLENGNDYFPPMPAVIPPTAPQTANSYDSRSDSRSGHHQHSFAAPGDHPRSISVLNTGQVPPLPSPGAASRRPHSHRPKYQRQPTSSPTVLAHPHNAGAIAVNPPPTSQQHLVHRQSTRPRMDSSASDHHHTNGVTAPPAPPLPTPPAPEAPPTNKNTSTPPTPSIAGIPSLGAHRPSRPKKNRRSTPENKASSRLRPTRENGDGPTDPATSTLTANSMLDGSVPPINVLIVEDNIINLRILESLMKRLKVRWQTAMNGQIAVDKWREGGFHLVLMDIQMPVMSGLQATKEIRRLERVNGIGVFSSSSASAVTSPVEDGGDNSGKGKGKGDDKLQTSMFKSPIIIVALTASSLQSDRHEALAAGCNDFLTKPVNFVWLERKVKEWGCMQALIDFDGWRKWKDYATKQEEGKSEAERQKEREKAEKEKVRAEKYAKLQEKQAQAAKEKERKKRQSLSESGEGSTGTSGTGSSGVTAGPILRAGVEA